jgi:hypothetical protein
MARRTKKVEEGGSSDRLLHVGRNIGAADLPAIDFSRILLYS